MYDDRIIIVYNTSLNPTEEIYNKPDNDPNNNDNNGGITIYKTKLNLENEQEKSRPISNEFKRLLNGGEPEAMFERKSFLITALSFGCFSISFISSCSLYVMGFWSVKLYVITTLSSYTTISLIN